MGAAALRIERPSFAILMALGLCSNLGGCFGSHTPYVGAGESLKLFGDRGEAVRVHIGSGPAEDVEFRWTGDAYELSDEAGRRDPASYRIAPLRDAWMITQRTERGVAEYGLARRDGSRLWTYAPQCRDLSDADRKAIGVVMQPNGSCWVSSPQQLRGALQTLLPRNPKPDGYYELQKR